MSEIITQYFLKHRKYGKLAKVPVELPWVPGTPVSPEFHERLFPQGTYTGYRLISKDVDQVDAGVFNRKDIYFRKGFYVRTEFHPKLIGIVTDLWMLEVWTKQTNSQSVGPSSTKLYLVAHCCDVTVEINKQKAIYTEVVLDPFHTRLLYDHLDEAKAVVAGIVRKVRELDVIRDSGVGETGEPFTFFYDASG